MRVAATIQGHTVVVFIDSSSTHNFINELVNDRLRLLIKPIPPFSVKVVDDRLFLCQGQFNNVSITIQEKLRPVKCHWKHLTMSFQFDGCRWTLSGLDAPTIQLASISEVTQEVDRTHLMCAICWLTEEQPGVNGKIAEEVENRPDMLKLLAKYEEVF